MTTRDPALPAELSLVSIGPASLSNGAGAPSASPGVGLAATRVPSGPTVPDLDPASLTLAISRYVNDLYAAPASAQSVAHEPAAPPLELSQPEPAASAPVFKTPTEPAAPTPTPTTPSAQPPRAPAGNPFAQELSFDGLAAAIQAATPEVLRFSLIDDPAPEPAHAHAQSAKAPRSSTIPRAEQRTFAHEIKPETTLELPSAGGPLDAHALKSEFPILSERVHGKPLVWLDNAATTQKPRAVIERLKTYYERENSNIHRAAHALAARATDAYEAARESVRRFLNASSARDVVFVRGTTEGINLVAQSWGRRNVGAGDEIVVTHLEHHANIVPWQMLCAEKGAKLRVAPVDDRGQILLDEYERLLNDRTKIVALPQVSNALGTVTPAREMIAMAHRYGAKVLLDGAQSVSHMRQDVQWLGPDFFVFSGHKVFGPTGIGAVVAPAALLDATPPWQGGGNMIADVTFEKTVFQPAPARFEAGTGNIADAVGLGAALDWLTRVGIENVERHEHALLEYGTALLRTVPGLHIIGTAAEKAGVLSFVIDGHSTHEVSTYLDKQGIAVRGGHHCAQPILRRFGLESTVRASLAPYNTQEDLDALTDALCRLVGRGNG
ncbi:MAG: family 2A encapsulin nanocompartment cargo protein cysteine desulfurase [Polyangiales bacterium]